MSKWKNKGGKTVLKNIVAQCFSSRPIELLTSPAYCVLTRTEHLVLSRIEIELRRHAGHANGNLIVTKEQFTEYIGSNYPKGIAPAVRTLEALGIIKAIHGRGGNADHRCPNRFLLNYLCGAVDAHEQITNAWNKIQTVKQAKQIAQIARNARNLNKVNYGRRIAKRRNQGAKHTPEPGCKMHPENANSPGCKMHPTVQGAKYTPLSKSRVVVGDAAAVSNEPPTDPGGNGTGAMAAEPIDELAELRRHGERLRQLAEAAVKLNGRMN